MRQLIIPILAGIGAGMVTGIPFMIIAALLH